MKQTFKRLLTNGILMCNNLAAIFYVLGAMPFFIFAPKYLEIMFAQSAAFASIISGKTIIDKLSWRSITYIVLQIVKWMLELGVLTYINQFLGKSRIRSSNLY